MKLHLILKMKIVSIIRFERQLLSALLQRNGIRFVSLFYVLFLALLIAVSLHPNFDEIFVLILFLAFVFYEYTWLPFFSKSLFEKQRKFFNSQVTLIFKQDEIVEICADK